MKAVCMILQRKTLRPDVNPQDRNKSGVVCFNGWPACRHTTPGIAGCFWIAPATAWLGNSAAASGASPFGLKAYSMCTMGQCVNVTASDQNSRSRQSKLNDGGWRKVLGTSGWAATQAQCTIGWREELTTREGSESQAGDRSVGHGSSDTGQQPRPRRRAKFAGQARGLGEGTEA